MSRLSQESLPERQKWKKASKKASSSVLSKLDAKEVLRRRLTRKGNAAVENEGPQSFNLTLPDLERLLYVSGEEGGPKVYRIILPSLAKSTITKAGVDMEVILEALENSDRLFTRPTEVVPASAAERSDQSAKELSHNLAKLSNAVADLESRFEQMTQRLEARLK